MAFPILQSLPHRPHPQPRTEYAPPAPAVSAFPVVQPVKKEVLPSSEQPSKVPETSLSPTAFLTTDASLYEQQLHQQHQQVERAKAVLLSFSDGAMHGRSKYINVDLVSVKIWHWIPFRLLSSFTFSVLTSCGFLTSFCRVRDLKIELKNLHACMHSRFSMNGLVACFSHKKLQRRR